MAHGLYKNARFRLAGDRGLLVEYGDGIDPAINHKVRSMAVVLAERRPAGVIEIVPTYRSLLILYDPSTTGPEALKPDLAALESQLAGIRIRPPKTVEIPVRYGGEYGPDIGFVADAHGLTEEEVVGLHSAPEYLIYMVGFTPGFPFLGGLPETLHTPRLETPRTHVPEGSVGIANAQTGVYPVASPGGWRLIGRTPLRLFAPDRETPFLYEAGDRIRFVPVSAEQYARIADQERLP